jgi:hypothetical protein
MAIPTDSVCSAVRAAGALVTRAHNAQLSEADFWALLDILHQAIRGSDALALYPGRFTQHELGRNLATRLCRELDHWASPPRGGFWPAVVKALRELPPVDAEGLIANIRAETEAPPAGRKVTLANTDTAADKRTRRADNRKRPLNDEARACIRAFKRQQQSDSPVAMKPFCRDYAEEKGCSFDSLYRTITDHPDAWQVGMVADKTADNSV